MSQRKFTMSPLLGMPYGTTSGRFSCSTPNPSNIPKTFDYGDLEVRVIAAMYPGADGIGADLCMDILQMDDVIYEQFDPYTGSRQLRAKVLRFDQNKDSAEIEFEQKGLIPPTMWVPVKDLRQAWGGRVVNVEKFCPKCEIPWKETMLARFSVWDCPSCGAKKEDHCLSKR